MRGWNGRGEEGRGGGRTREGGGEEERGRRTVLHDVVEVDFGDHGGAVLGDEVDLGGEGALEAGVGLDDFLLVFGFDEGLLEHGETLVEDRGSAGFTVRERNGVGKVVTYFGLSTCV